MPSDHCDCLVVGGGIMGLLTALELRRGGAAVRLVERGRVGRAASWAGGGILSPLRPWACPDPVARLAAWSQRRWPELCEWLRDRTGVDPELLRCGLVVMESGADEQAAAAAWARRWSATVACGPLSPEVTAALGACAGDGARERQEAGIVLPEVAQVRNPRLLRALHEALRREGVEVLEGAGVDAVRVRRGQVAGVRAGGRELACGTLVLAAGAWTPGLLPRGVCPPRVEPVRGQMLLWRARPGLLRTILLRGEHYLVPRRDGRVLCGSTLERVGFRARPTAEGRRRLERAARRLCPALASAGSIEAHWAGLRPQAPGGIPYVCPHPDVRGLYLNVGQFRNGLVTAPASARLLADLVLGRAPVMPPGPFAFDARREAGQDLNPCVD